MLGEDAALPARFYRMKPSFLCGLAWLGAACSAGGSRASAPGPDGRSPVAASVRAASATKPKPKPMRIMTYNVNYGLAGDQDTLEAIRAGDADLVLLQETNSAWRQAIEGALAADYPHSRFRDWGLAGGLGVLSRWPIREEHFTPSPHGWFPAWRLIIDTPRGALQVFNLHLRPPLSARGTFLDRFTITAKHRVKEITSYFQHVDPAIPALFAGDFNEDAQGGAIAFLRKNGYRDVMGDILPDTPTWRWDTPMGKVHWQLDHVVYGRGLRARTVKVLQAGRSDHLPGRILSVVAHCFG